MPAKTRVSSAPEDFGIPMASLIDVVFLLLVYFVLTLSPRDVNTHLDVFRPGTPPVGKPPVAIPRAWTPRYCWPTSWAVTGPGCTPTPTMVSPQPR